jgi:hypothetical protein
MSFVFTYFINLPRLVVSFNGILKDFLKNPVSVFTFRAKRQLIQMGKMIAEGGGVIV